MNNTANQNQTSDKEKVRKLLHKAFPSLDVREDLTALSHLDCVEMRSQLPGLSPQDLPFYVCQVLEDLLDTHTGRIGDTEHAEGVVQYLDVLGQGIDLETIKEMYGKEGMDKTMEDEQCLTQARLHAFSLFTSGQANAIVKWLEHAQTWPEMKWYMEDFKAALAYWRTRAN